MWWQISDDDSVSIIKKYIADDNISVLEPGCGSGGSSFYLSRFIYVSKLTLCDISANALGFARSIEPADINGRVDYVQAEISTMPFNDDSFDLTWNVGVIEHYLPEQIAKMVNEMKRVTKKNGYVIVAIPNKNSIATLKAWLLGSKYGRKFLAFIPGYKFDSEILYKNLWLKNFLMERTQNDVNIEYAGNMLWVGAPEWLVRKTNSWFPKSKCSFLTFFVFKK